MRELSEIESKADIGSDLLGLVRPVDVETYRPDDRVVGVLKPEPVEVLHILGPFLETLERIRTQGVVVNRSEVVVAIELEAQVGPPDSHDLRHDGRLSDSDVPPDIRP